MAENIASLPEPYWNIAMIAKVFNYESQDEKRETGGLSKFNASMINVILLSWYSSIEGNQQEPRRLFAKMIAELGAQLSQTQESEDDQKKVRSEFERMAKELDVYFVAEDTSM